MSARTSALETAARAVIHFALLTTIVWLGCGPGERDVTAPQDPQANVQQLLRPAMSVQDRHTEELLQIPGVVGTATILGEGGEPVIVIFTESADVRGLPDRLEGYGVRVVPSGRFHALQGARKCDNPPCNGGGGGGGGGGDTSLKLTDHWPSPVPIGVSVGNNNECSAGTFGAVVIKGSARYALSNNHVFARENKASNGEPIVQPGRYDNKPKCGNDVSTEKLGTLADYVTIRFGSGTNTVDAAIAQPASGVTLSCATAPGYYGLPGSTTRDAALGMAIQKVGRTSGLTTAVVTALNATVKVGYSSGTATFTGQIVTSSGFSRSGDSGSLVVTNDANRNPVGLLFAGAVDGTTILNPIDDVLAALGGAAICGS
jgi:hypothetical protein